ncbi:MAG: DUF7305 domain-containing protein [bacterium]
MKKNRNLKLDIITFLLLICMFLALQTNFYNVSAGEIEISYQSNWELPGSSLITSHRGDLELILGLPDIDTSSGRRYQLQEFPEFRQLPFGLRNMGNATIENWSSPVIINENVSYNKLTIRTELIIDTRNGNRSIRTRDLDIEGNGEITIRGNGRVFLFVEGDLNLQGSSSINSEGSSVLLHLYHTGNRVRIQGSASGNGNKFSGNFYSDGQEIQIDGGARIAGNIYARRGKLSFKSSTVNCQEIYSRDGDIEISNGARVNSALISGGDNIRITGGSHFDGRSDGIQAPYASIRIDQGVTLNSRILGNPDKIRIEHINEGQSSYWIEDANSANSTGGSKRRIVIYSSRNDPGYKLFFWRNNRWARIPSSRRERNRIVYNVVLDTNRILISNPSNNPISKVEID